MLDTTNEDENNAEPITSLVDCAPHMTRLDFRLRSGHTLLVAIKSSKTFRVPRSFGNVEIIGAFIFFLCAVSRR